jgi:hypothetical protein
MLPRDEKYHIRSVQNGNVAKNILWHKFDLAAVVSALALSQNALAQTMPASVPHHSRGIFSLGLYELREEVSKLSHSHFLSIRDGEVLDSRSLTAYSQAEPNHLHVVPESNIRRVSE